MYGAAAAARWLLALPEDEGVAEELLLGDIE